MFAVRDPLYLFVDDAVTDPLEGVVMPTHLPSCLLDPSTWEIPAASRLLELTEDRSNGEAFYLWAQERLGAFEFLRQFRSIDYLAEVAADIRNRWYSNLGSMIEIEAERRNMLAPFTASALTLRQIAAATDLPLVEVVGTIFAAASRPRAEMYAELEERLIGGVLDRVSLASIVSETGMKHSTIVKLCDRHGIDRQAAVVARRKPNYRHRRQGGAAACAL